MSQTCFFYENHLSDTFQPAHLVDEAFHDNDGHNREKVFVVLYGINFKDYESLAKKVNILL